MGQAGMSSYYGPAAAYGSLSAASMAAAAAAASQQSAMTVLGAPAQVTNYTSYISFSSFLFSFSPPLPSPPYVFPPFRRRTTRMIIPDSISIRTNARSRERQTRFVKKTIRIVSTICRRCLVNAVSNF